MYDNLNNDKTSEFSDQFDKAAGIVKLREDVDSMIKDIEVTKESLIELLKEIRVEEAKGELQGVQEVIRQAKIRGLRETMMEKWQEVDKKEFSIDDFLGQLKGIVDCSERKYQKIMKEIKETFTGGNW